jgi:hypothetical protein
VATNGGVAEGAAVWGRNGGAGGAGWRAVAGRLVGSEGGRGEESEIGTAPCGPTISL